MTMFSISKKIKTKQKKTPSGVSFNIHYLRKENQQFNTLITPIVRPSPYHEYRPQCSVNRETSLSKG